MSKLKRFNKSNKKYIMPLVALCTVVAIVFAAISYAVYQKTDEIQFINAKVGEFETSSSDIELAMTLDGEDIVTPPKKDDGYYNVTVECDYADGIWESTDDRWGAYIYNISSNRVKCNVNFETLETRPLSIVEVGDYISMTPTSTSYTIPTSLTGYSSNQTINPSELNLWRVIKKNEDSTVDVVSEYVSSTDVYFYGRTGYMNLVGGLNTIAAQYTNEKYVERTRHIGYSNQIDFLTDTSTYGTSSPPWSGQGCMTWTCTESGFTKEQEAKGAGDIGYTEDYKLVNGVYGNMVGHTLDGVATPYYLASRLYYLSTQNIWYNCYRLVKADGSLIDDYFLSNSKTYGYQQKSKNNPVRPILTLKSSVGIISGDGKSAETAYQFS